MCANVRDLLFSALGLTSGFLDKTRSVRQILNLVTTSYTNAHTRTLAPFVGPWRGASGSNWYLDGALQSSPICTCPLQRSRCAVGYALHHCLTRLNAPCHTHTWLTGNDRILVQDARCSRANTHTHSWADPDLINDRSVKWEGASVNGMNADTVRGTV